MTCVPGSTANKSIIADQDSWHILVELRDENCTTGLFTLATLQRNPYNGTTQTQVLAAGRATLQKCLETDQAMLFVVFAQTEATAVRISNDSTVMTSTGWNVTHPSINTTILVCTPRYKVQKAMITTDLSGDLSHVDIKPETRNLTISNWDLWSAVDHSLVVAGPAFLEGPVNHGLRTGGSMYDELFGVMISTWTRSPIEYLNSDTLAHDTQRIFNAIASQIAASYLIVNSEGDNILSPAIYRTTQNRVLLLDIPLRVVEAGIAIIVICACLMMASPPWVVRSEAGTNTAVLAVALTRSDQLGSSLARSSIGSHEYRGRGIPTQNLACKGHDNSAEGDLSQACNSKHGFGFDTLTSDHRFWRPMVLSRLMTVIVIVTPVVVIASLEISYQISHRNDDSGLADVPTNPRWHYAWTWTPALIMTITKLFCQMVTSSISLLDPYSKLRKQSCVTNGNLCRSNLPKPSLQLCFESGKSKRWALLATALSALLGPFLTIVVSGLFYIQPGSSTLDVTLHLTDHIVSPTGKYCSWSDWTQASLSAATITQYVFDDGNTISSSGTYGNFIHPIPQSNSSYTSMKGARLFNASTFASDMPVVLSNVTCQVMDPDGFRYILESEGTNTSEVWNSDGPHEGDRSLTYMNLTHVDLSSWQCKDSWFMCGQHACTGDSTGCKSKMPSLGIEFYAKTSTPFVDILYASDLEGAPLKWADPSSWSNSSALMQAVAARNDGHSLRTPGLIAMYGFWSPGRLNVNGVKCYFDIRSGQADVTYDLSTKRVLDLHTNVTTFSPSLYTENCSPWNGPKGMQLESFLPNNGSLWSTVLEGQDVVGFYSLDGAAGIAERISRIYNTYYTQYYNVALREHDTTGDTNHTAGVMWDNDWQRLVQSKLSTCILQTLLAVMWLCMTIALILFDTKNLIPRNPCSIAAQASLLAGSKFLDLIPAGAENATAEELMQMTPFVDHEFSMGWWDDDNGGRRFGIDIGKADFDRDGDTANEEEVSDSA